MVGGARQAEQGGSTGAARTRMVGPTPRELLDQTFDTHHGLDAVGQLRARQSQSMLRVAALEEDIPEEFPAGPGRGALIVDRPPVASRPTLRLLSRLHGAVPTSPVRHSFRHPE